MSSLGSARPDAKTRRTARHDLIAGLVLIALSLFLFSASFDIPMESDDDGIGPRFFPQSICMLLAALGLVMALQGARKKSAPGDNSIFYGEVFVAKVLPLAVLSFVYLWLFVQFGYLLSTLVALYAAFLLFGVRGKGLVLMPPLMTVLFYYLFFGLMGVFEPPAEIFNLTDLFNG
ncbi:tripartite tricarboxylate transporter TctB family protein [Motiliproteus coralliicola]|nr:tripartite tricarboxylate transporter TctB family protein [Motiliproteus coralliicola]